MAYTKTPASGLQNIKITPFGNYAVFVKSVYLGTFKDRNIAITRRDEYIEKNNLPKAIDSRKEQI